MSPAAVDTLFCFALVSFIEDVTTDFNLTALSTRNASLVKYEYLSDAMNAL